MGVVRPNWGLFAEFAAEFGPEEEAANEWEADETDDGEAEDDGIGGFGEEVNSDCRSCSKKNGDGEAVRGLNGVMLLLDRRADCDEPTGIFKRVF